MRKTVRILSVFFLSSSAVISAQSKKEQISALSSRIDSFRTVVSVMKTTCSDNMDKLEGKIKELESELDRQRILYKNQTQDLTEVQQKLALTIDTAAKRDSIISIIQIAQKSSTDSFLHFQKLWKADQNKITLLKDIMDWKASYFEGEITDRTNNDTGGFFKIKRSTGEEYDLHFRTADADATNVLPNPLHVKDPIIWERIGLKVRGYSIKYEVATPTPAAGTARKVTPQNTKKTPQKTEIYRLLFMETF